jgi:hypothetical protein
MQNGGGNERRSWMSRARDLQQLVGLVLAIYGFFVGTSPERYTIPYLNVIFPTITTQQQSFAGFLVLVFGVLLFMKKKPLVEW